LPIPRQLEDDEEIIERRTLRDYYIILRERVWISLPMPCWFQSGSVLPIARTPLYQSKATSSFENGPHRHRRGVTRRSDERHRYQHVYRNPAQQPAARAVVDSLAPMKSRLCRSVSQNLRPAPPRASGSGLAPDIGSVRNSYLITISAFTRIP